jgi:hypothetical protein
MGGLVIVTLEGDDPGGSFGQMVSADDAFTKWFIGKAQEVHGVDISTPMTEAPSRLVIDTDQAVVAAR